MTIFKLLESKFDSLVNTGSVSERLYDWRYRKVALNINGRGLRIISEHNCLLPDISTRLDALWIDLPSAAQVSGSTSFLISLFRELTIYRLDEHWNR